ncbi:MAG: hypothetical protein CVU90_06865 [Firmicutes bacterium HGW-Firmicutes-15]|nr:MAG: hypothetical protein CVU90_06865 [Firmicutes bacterium HGW-Firmicutes-15]
MRKWISAIIVSLLIIATTSQGIMASESQGDQTVGKTLTFEQAADLALKNSTTIKSADYNIESGELVRNASADNAKCIPSDGTNSTASRAYTSLVSADISWNMSKKTRTLEGDKLELSVYKEYINMIKAIENLNYAQVTLKNTQWQWNVAQINYQVGITSQTQKNASDTELKAAQNSLRLAEIALDTEYQTFNKLVGLNPTERPVLAEKPNYSLLKIDDLQSSVTRTLEQSPSVWKVDQSVIQAQLAIELYDWSSSSTSPYKTKQIALTQAELSASETKEQVAQAVRDLYNSICNQEETYNTQQEAIKLAEDTLRVKRVMFEIGMATKTDVQTAELALEKAKKDLNATIYQHEYLKLTFAKPWAAS